MFFVYYNKTIFIQKILFYYNQKILFYYNQKIFCTTYKPCIYYKNNSHSCAAQVPDLCGFVWDFNFGEMAR